MVATFVDGLQRLLDFTDYLRSQRLLFHISQENRQAITVSFGTFGERFSLDFDEQSVTCRRYRAMKEIELDAHEICAMIEAGSGASAWPPIGPGSNFADATASSGGMRRLLDFTAQLRAKGVVHRIEQQSCDALEVSYLVQGSRIEVEFSPDYVAYNAFHAELPVAFDEDALRREVEVFTRPYHPVMRMRGELLQLRE